MVRLPLVVFLADFLVDFLFFVEEADFFFADFFFVDFFVVPFLALALRVRADFLAAAERFSALAMRVLADFLAAAERFFLEAAPPWTFEFWCIVSLRLGLHRCWYTTQAKKSGEKNRTRLWEAGREAGGGGLGVGFVFFVSVGGAFVGAEGFG
jgi:hypothetical protein